MSISLKTHSLLDRFEDLQQDPLAKHTKELSVLSEALGDLDTHLLKRASDLLLKCTIKDGNGFGIGIEVDAFGDGSYNQLDTVYGIVVARSSYALLKAYELIGDDRYLRVAKKALDFYLRYYIPTKKHFCIAAISMIAALVKSTM